jgi:hypothetical protein
MAKKNKDGKWEFDDEDEARIAIFEEGVRRANAKNKPKDEPWDGKVDRRKTERRAPPKKEKSFW